MKHYIGNCIDNPFRNANHLIHITDSAKEITKEWFLTKCRVEPQIRKLMNEYPHDFTYYSYNNGKIMFYKHSMIEHFYR